MTDKWSPRVQSLPCGGIYIPPTLVQSVADAIAEASESWDELVECGSGHASDRASWREAADEAARLHGQMVDAMRAHRLMRWDLDPSPPSGLDTWVVVSQATGGETWIVSVDSVVEAETDTDDEAVRVAARLAAEAGGPGCPVLYLDPRGDCYRVIYRGGA